MATMEDAALRNLMNIMSQPPLQQSPEKLAGLEDIMANVAKGINGIPQFMGITDLSAADSISKAAASSSSGSVSPREEGLEDGEGQAGDIPAPAPNGRQYRSEPWHECFTTTKEAEFDALIYSIYVMKKDGKTDGYDNYECINRLQSKCRYKIRTKKVNEFFIVEEKGAHNHAMEPVGSPGSHAGLPKTLREIVDMSFYNEWPNSLRQQKIEEEVKRLGLPHNPRLGRQVDNRIAYLRRVKNLTETRKAQDQVANGIPISTMPPMNRPDLALGNGANPDEILKFMMQMSQNGVPIEEQLKQIPMDSVPVSVPNVVVPQPTVEAPPVSQAQIIVHENSNDLMNTILQQMNKGEIPDQHIMSMLMSNGLLPAQTPAQAVPMEEDSTASSSPDDRLHIDD